MSSPKILVVDDEKSTRQLITEVLTPMGYEITEAPDGVEAIDIIQKFVPDLVILDVNMPRLDGYSVCKLLRSNPQTRLVPIVMLTSLSDLENRVKGIEIGVNDFLTKPFNLAELKARVRSLVTLKHFTDELENANDVIKSIALIVEKRDGYTGDHCKRVGHYTTLIGKQFGLDEETLEVLRLAGSFHDLGKIAIPDAILRKPAKLDQQEFEIIKSHTVIGGELCQSMQTMSKVLPLIKHHHEKLDGSGYPDGLKGNEIPIAVRIISVSDIYDALATKRSYKEAFPPEKCISILKEEACKGWWDKDVVETLAKVVNTK